MIFWLVKAREDKKMSQCDLAKEVGLSQQAISTYENGERTPSVDTAKAIAKVLGFKWTKFFDDKK